ncbi:hypothetical protein DY000_02048951 [Brassica cretica]|uniref:Uncharacterized protein n=1 Tax=Brassica cretica TaxID=69181 RepID=A0ABQ7EY01_BRACR|nr:hypothetical protein DY000_02048951 [Brassica cretica]
MKSSRKGTLQSEQPKDCSSGRTTHCLFLLTSPVSAGKRLDNPHPNRNTQFAKFIILTASIDRSLLYYLISILPFALNGVIGLSFDLLVVVSRQFTMARTKQSAKRTRATCTSSTPPRQAQQQTSATYPWPREQEGKPIDLDSPLLLDFNCEGWDKGTTAR